MADCIECKYLPVVYKIGYLFHYLLTNFDEINFCWNIFQELCLILAWYGIICHVQVADVPDWCVIHVKIFAKSFKSLTQHYFTETWYPKKGRRTPGNWIFRRLHENFKKSPHFRQICFCPFCVGLFLGHSLCIIISFGNEPFYKILCKKL